MPDHILNIKALSLDYKTKTQKLSVLDGLDLVQKNNEWLALIGPNGAGKTSLGLIIKGILKPTQGIIRMFSENIDEDLRLRKAKVGFLFSNPRDQICSMSVQDDIAFGLVHQGLPRKQIRKRVYEAMEALSISHLAYHSTHRISGGEQQKVALAGLIAMRPEYIILDEPASFLNPKETDELLQIVKGLHQSGMSILYISTSWEEVSMADQIAVLDQGRITYISSPQKLLKEEKTLAITGLCPPLIYLLAKRLHKNRPSFPEHIQDVEKMTNALIRHFKKNTPGPSYDHKAG